MICYTHRDNRAIGICKYCGKAVCDECAIVDNSGIACSERCHQELLAYAVMAEKSKAVYGMKSGRIPITTIFLLAAGAVFLLMGVYFASKGIATWLLLLPMAVIFLILGALSYINIRRTGIRS
ncbi:MAG: hypothetical protein LC131_15455 [Anaerolineae bacterium]|nr:hypothetical protein [Anaerolineae bacterium]